MDKFNTYTVDTLRKAMADHKINMALERARLAYETQLLNMQDSAYQHHIRDCMKILGFNEDLK